MTSVWVKQLKLQRLTQRHMTDRQRHWQRETMTDMTDRDADRQKRWQTETMTDRHRQTETQTDTDRQRHWQTDRDADRQPSDDYDDCIIQSQRDRQSLLTELLVELSLRWRLAAGFLAAADDLCNNHNSHSSHVQCIHNTESWNLWEQQQTITSMHPTLSFLTIGSSSLSSESESTAELSHSFDFTCNINNVLRQPVTDTMTSVTIIATLSSCHWHYNLSMTLWHLSPSLLHCHHVTDTTTCHWHYDICHHHCYTVIMSLTLQPVTATMSSVTIIATKSSCHSHYYTVNL